MYRARLPALLLLSAAALWPADGIAVRVGDRTLTIPRVGRPPKLSDYLTGAPREAETVITDFRQYMPGDGTPASQPTTAYLSYDDSNLYIGFYFKDDPKLIRARVAKREQIFSDDRISICIDTFHDHRHMYWFDVNPYGIQADGNVTDGVEDDPSWDTLWHSQAKLTPDGYAGLVAIPFRSIRFPGGHGDQTWGIILGRWIMRYNEFALWPIVSRKRPGFVQQGGDLEGIHGISPGRNLQLIPYGMFASSRFLDTTVPRFAAENSGRVGLDAKMVLKDALTVDVALNPDFSQVESDEPQVSVNQRFEVVYPEKRPFFMENAGYFKTPERLFFSRRIADPRFGGRITGKIGKWAIGALLADDRGPGERLSRQDPLFQRNSVAGVFRIQREFFHNSNAAVMATTEDFGSTYNRVYSFDTRLQLLPNWILSAQAMTSVTRLPGGALLNGPAYLLDWRHEGKHFISETIYKDRSPNFRANLGYFDRVDIREAAHTVGYKWRPESKWISSIGPRVKAGINYNRLGQMQDWFLIPEFLIELTRMTEITVERREAFELFNTYGFRHHHNSVEAQSEWTRWLAFTAAFTNGRAINYYPGSGRAPFLGEMREVAAGFTLRPMPKLRLDERYVFSGLKTTHTAPSDLGVPAGAGIFSNHIARSKVNYQFNREASLRFIVDYNSVLPNSTLVSLDKTKHLGFDVLFTYMLNPGTALHVGYTDLYDNLLLDPRVSPVLKRTAFPDLNTGRQVFVKLSYLLRF